METNKRWLERLILLHKIQIQKNIDLQAIINF